MEKPVEIARRVIALAADAASSTVKITSRIPLITQPSDLFGRTLIDLGISDDATILLFKSHLQRFAQDHVPHVKVGHLAVTHDTHLNDLSVNLTNLILAETTTHGTDEPPPPEPKPKGSR
jgi:hypothetical protein